MENPVRDFLEFYFQEHPENAAKVIVSQSDHELASLVQTYSPTHLAKVFDRLPAQLLSDGLQDAPNQTVAAIFAHLDSALVARIARRWRTTGHLLKVDSVISQLSAKLAQKILALADYPEGTVGALMNPTPFTVAPNYTIANVLEMLKKRRDRYSRYIYVVGVNKELLGVIPFKEAFYSDPHLVISELMSNKVTALKVTTSIQEVLKDKYWNEWDSLPVVNTQNQLRGVLRYDVLASSAQGALQDKNGHQQIASATEALGEVVQIGVKAALSALIPKKGASYHDD